MNLILYLVVIALFLLATGFRLFAEGMFVDGVTYAAISRNLANGLGSFWDPHFTAILYPQFHEHPPLALGMQGLVFRIFGDSLLVERFYSLATFLFTGYLIVLIWHELTGDKKSGWIPLLFWICIPTVSWAAASNLLDNTLTLFTTLAILLVLKSYSRRQPIYLVMAGFSVFAGLLTKGPFALFPLVLPMLWEFTQPFFKLKKAVLKTLTLVASTLVPLLILILFSSEARESLHSYWLSQVVASIEGVKTVGNRFYILGSLLTDLLLPASLAGITFLIFRKRISHETIGKYKNPAMVMLILGLCGVLPIMISLKQRSFYILDALPLFALAIALPVWNIVKEFFFRSDASKSWIKHLRYAAIVLLLVSIILPPIIASKSHKDQEKLAMIHDFSTVIPRGTTIRINPLLFNDWSLHSYFARHSEISLDPSENVTANFYLLMDSDVQPAGNPGTWTRIRRLNGFVLFKK